MKKSLILLTFVAAVLSAMVQQPGVASSQTGTPIKELIGVNAVVNNTPSEVAKAAGWVRDYHKWYWYEAVNDTYTWSTGWQKLDSFYGQLKAAGVKVMPDVEFAPGWASSNGQRDGIPNAAEHAEYLGALTRHYGDTIAAVENYNEPNQWWQPVRFPADKFGAMTAQDHDAVKAANPRMPLVMAGMAGADTTYLDAAHRASGGKYDVVNFHWYAQGDTTNGGKNPEAGNLFADIDRVKAWRDAKAPGKPIWITEFGWDTYKQPNGQKSKIYAPEGAAANYLLRALFLMQGRGVDKGFAYIYRDVSDNETYLHSVYLSSGLVTNDGEKDGRKKPGWYYLATLKGVLGEYVFDRIVANGPYVYRYEYLLPGTNQRAALMWARNGDRDNGYRTSYVGPAGTLVEPVDGSTTGVSSATDGRLTLTERPVFVLYSSISSTPATSTPTSAPTWTPTTSPTFTPTAAPTWTPTVAPSRTPTTIPPVFTPTAIPTFTPTAIPTSVPSAVPTQPGMQALSLQERLANGGFESGLSGWHLPSWFADVTKVDGVQVRSGSAALRFEGSADGPNVYQEVAASPGQRVEFSGWVNVPQRRGAQTLIVELVARHGGNGDLKRFEMAGISGTTTGWVQISGSAVMPDRTVAVRLYVRFPALDGIAYLDDISLRSAGSGLLPTPAPSPTPTAWAQTPTATAVPTGAPLPTATPTPSQGGAPGGSERLVNGGFESGLSGWYLPSWFDDEARADGTLVRSGAAALHFQGNANGPYVYQELAASAGQQVEVSGWVNIPQRRGNMGMVVELVPRHQYNGDLAIVPIANFGSTTSGWVPIRGTATLPDRTVAVRLKIRFPALDGAAYLDDLSLRLTGTVTVPTATPAPTRPPVTGTPTATRPPATPTPTRTPGPSPTATAAPLPTTPAPTPTPLPTVPAGPTQPPAGGSALANTPWPTYGGNALRNNRSPYVGPQQQPVVRWTFNRTNDHWGTDYRGTGIGPSGTVYMAAGMAGVYAADSRSGQMKWLFSPENTGWETWVEFPPTVAADGKLYVTSENDYVYALDPNGRVLWKYRTNHLHTPVSISPDGSTVHVISENGYIYALNRADGTLKWKYQLGKGVYATGRRKPVVYDASGNLFFAYIGTAWSLTPDGQKRWSVGIPSRGSYMSGPALSEDGTLYFNYSDSIEAVGMDGRHKWTYILNKTAFDRTPTIGPDGTIYIGNQEGYLYALNPNGTLKWMKQYVRLTTWGGGIKSNLLLDARGTLYFLGKDSSIYAVSSATQQLLWKHNAGPLDNNSYPGMQLSLDSDGTLYAPVGEGVVLALAPSGGAAPPPLPTSTPTRQPLPTATPLPVATSTPTPGATAPPAPTATPVPTAPPTPGTTPAGSILYGSWVGSAVNVAGNESLFEQATGKPRAIRHWYWSVAPISVNAANFTTWSSSMPAGAILMLSYAPSPADSTLDNVNSGKHDAYIAQWATALKGYGREAWLRLMWEDNGSWYWWNSGANWDTTKKNKYKAAFQRVVNLFRQAGATNVKFIWSPNASGNGSGTASESYPGDAYVDWVGLDGYPFKGGKGDFYSTFKSDYDALSKLGKPMMISETGISITSDSSRAAYVTNLLTYELPTRFPNFKAFVWFSEPGWGDLLDPAYPQTLNAFRSGIANPYYRGR